MLELKTISVTYNTYRKKRFLLNVLYTFFAARSKVHQWSFTWLYLIASSMWQPTTIVFLSAWIQNHNTLQCMSYSRLGNFKMRWLCTGCRIVSTWLDYGSCYLFMLFSCIFLLLHLSFLDLFYITGPVHAFVSDNSTHFFLFFFFTFKGNILSISRMHSHPHMHTQRGFHHFETRDLGIRLAEEFQIGSPRPN